MTVPGREAPAGDARPELRRELTLLDAVGIGLGAIVGAGIFVVSGVAAGIAGPALLLGLLIAGAAAALNALSTAQLAAEYPQSGGAYEYGRRVLGPWAGFAAGWMFLASKLTAAGTVALGLAGYLAGLWPALPTRAVAVGAIVCFTALNYVGVRRSSRVNLAIVAVSVGSLVLLVLFGASSFRMENLRPFAPSGWRGVLQSAAILFFAYTGYARIATLGEEVREPRVTIPRAIVTTIVGAVLLYGAVALVAVGVAGPDALAGSTAPLRVVSEQTGRHWLPIVVSVGATAAMLGVILSQLLGLSRMVFAMARAGDLPRALGTVHPTRGVPDRAVLVVGAIAAIIAATGTLATTATAAAFTILVYYGIANVAALRMPRDAKRYPDAVPVLGLAGCVLLAASLQRETIVVGIGVLGAGLVARWIVVR